MSRMDASKGSASPSPTNAGASAASGSVTTSSERFTCRVNVEDFCLTVERKDANAVQSVWEEMRVVCSFSGQVTKTRWLPTPIALKKLHDGEARRREAREEQDVDPTVRNEDLQQAQHYSISRRQIHRDPVAREEPAVPSNGAPQSLPSAAPGSAFDDLVGLYLSKFNDMSFDVQFTTDPERESASPPRADTADDDIKPAGRRFVRPKKVHHMRLEVEAQNADRLFSTTGGVGGDEKPTSSNMEAVSAAYRKGASKLSAWTRNIFRKRSSGDAEKEKEAKGAAQRKALEEYLSQRDDNEAAALDVYKGRGAYSPVVSSVDLAEAYNAPGGKKRFHLVLKRDSSRLPSRGTGVPVIVSFTARVQYADPRPEPIRRNFHNFCLVVDQVSLDLTRAAATVSTPGDGAMQPLTITGYGFGLASDMSKFRSGGEPAPAVRSVIVPMNLSTLQTVGADRPTTVIDFASQHRTQDETQLTQEDYERLPTSSCVVSTSCKVGSKERIGNRVVLFSRFNTSKEGLCKPSYKCQLAVFLQRETENGHVGYECTRLPIDLSSILNMDFFRPHVRQVSFSLGELIYLRIRRFSFVDPEFNRAPLLQPHDSDYIEELPMTAALEPVASWVNPRRGGQPGTQGPANLHPPQPAHAAEDENSVDLSASTTSSTEPSIDPDNPFAPSADEADGTGAALAPQDSLFTRPNMFATQSNRRSDAPPTVLPQNRLADQYDPHEMFSVNPRAAAQPPSQPKQDPVPTQNYGSAVATDAEQMPEYDFGSGGMPPTLINRPARGASAASSPAAHDFTVTPSRDDYYENMFGNPNQEHTSAPGVSAAAPSDTYRNMFFTSVGEQQPATAQTAARNTNAFAFGPDNDNAASSEPVVTFEITPFDDSKPTF